MLNEEVARIFERMARVLAFKGEDRFRVMAYERAAVSIRDLKEDLSSIAKAGKLEEIPGIGKDLSEMIAEYVATHKIGRYEKECRGIKPGLIELMTVPGLGPKTLALLHRSLRVNDLAGLKRCLGGEAIRKLKGFGRKKVENIRRGLDLWEGSQKRMLISVALPLAENFLDRTLGTEHPDTLAVMYLLGDTNESQGHHAQAEVLFTNVWESRRRKLGSKNPQTLDALARLGGVRFKQGKYVSAAAALREALAPDEKTGLAGLQRDASQSILGASLAAQGKYAGAEPLLLAGYAGLLQRESTLTVHDRVKLEEACELVVKLYQSWGKPEKVSTSLPRACSGDM